MGTKGQKALAVEEVPEEEEEYAGDLVYNKIYNNCTINYHVYDGAQLIEQTGKPQPWPPPQP